MASFNDLIKSSIPVLIHLVADWATPCEELKPILKNVKRAKGEALNIIKIDIEKNPSIARKFNIVGLPALLLFQEGKIKWRHVGLLTDTELLEQINSI